MEKKRFSPNALAYVNYLSTPAIHPLGKKVAYVVSKADTQSGIFYSAIKETDCKDVIKVQTEIEKVNVKSPRYSKDGKWLAYLSNESGEFQIYVKDENEGVVQKLTSLRHGIKYFNWSPDGSELVFSAPLWEKEIKEDLHFREMKEDEKKEWLEEKEWEPVEIEEIDYKNDDCFGLRDGSKHHIGIVERISGKQRLVTKEEMECSFPAFSADGKYLAFYGKPYKGARASFPELFEAKRDDAGEFADYMQVTKEESLFLMDNLEPCFSLDNSKIYVAAYAEFDNGCLAQTLYCIDRDSKEYKNLLPMEEDGITVGLSGEPISRTVFGEESPYYLIDEEEKYLYFTNAWNGWQNLYRMPLDGSMKIESLIENKLNVHGFTLPVNGTMMLLGGDTKQIAELYSFSIDEGFMNQITYSNDWMEEYEFGKVEMLCVPTKDGSTNLNVWLIHPVGEQPGIKYPAVLDIHGGPECSYVSDFWHEFQAIANSGMYCVYTNPRGSLSHGPSFVGNEYSWGQEAYDDLMTAVDTAIQYGQIDADKLGVTGGSYGGYMTNKLIIESDRFKAAVTQRCLINTATSYGTGDMGFISRREKNLSQVKMLDVLTKRARGSLMRKVDQINTPLLILHGYRDYRCSFEQAEQLFIAMKERKPQVPVRLVMFPEDNHGITRTGKLDSQIRHLEELIHWFNKYLKKEEGNDETGISI